MYILVLIVPFTTSVQTVMYIEHKRIDLDYISHSLHTLSRNLRDKIPEVQCHHIIQSNKSFFYVIYSTNFYLENKY